MNLPSTASRPAATRLVVAALGLLLAVVLVPASPAAAAGERAGDVVVVDESGSPLGGGGSATAFGLEVPDGAACQGDSAHDDYRVEAFLVPEGTDPGGLVYGELAPEGEGNWGLWDTNTMSFDGAFTSEAKDGGPGLIVNLPMFSFGVLLPGEMPPGDYRIGIACSLQNETTRYWDTSFAIVADTSDPVAQFRWTAADPAGGTGSDSDIPTPVKVLLVVVVVLVAVAAVAAVVLARRTRSDRTTPPKERLS